MLRGIAVCIVLIITGALTVVGIYSPAEHQIYWLIAWLVTWMINIGLLTTRKKPVVTAAQVKYAMEQEALCRALFEMSWERVHAGKVNPRPKPLPGHIVGSSDPIGEGFYKRKMRELLE